MTIRPAISSNEISAVVSDVIVICNVAIFTAGFGKLVKLNVLASLCSKEANEIVVLFLPLPPFVLPPVEPPVDPPDVVVSPAYRVPEPVEKLRVVDGFDSE
jgi:hypothetical protein